MEAIFFDRDKNRITSEIEGTPETYSIIKTDTEVAYKVEYKMCFYDKKSRPVYIEKSRTKIEIELT